MTGITATEARSNLLVYQVLEDERVVKVIRLWSHYE